MTDGIVQVVVSAAYLVLQMTVLPVVAYAQAPKPATGTLTIAVAAEATMLAPTRSFAGVDQYFFGQMFEQLGHPDLSLKRVNWLAESWEIKEEDGKPYLDIHLRKGDGLLAQSVTGEPPARKGSAGATSLFRGCPRCSGTEDWLAVDIDQPDSLAALSQMIGMDKSSSPEQIEPLLANWTARRSAVEAAGTLQHAGIAAAPVQPVTGLLTDLHLIVMGFWQRAERCDLISTSKEITCI